MPIEKSAQGTAEAATIVQHRFYRRKLGEGDAEKPRGRAERHGDQTGVASEAGNDCRDPHMARSASTVAAVMVTGR